MKRMISFLLVIAMLASTMAIPTFAGEVGEENTYTTLYGDVYSVLSENLMDVDGLNGLTNALGEKLTWGVVNATSINPSAVSGTKYVHPTTIGGGNTANTMRTFVPIEGGKKYLVTHTIYNDTGYQTIEQQNAGMSAVVATGEAVFGTFTGLRVYSHVEYGGCNSWSNESSITCVGSKVARKDTVTSPGYNKMEYIIDAPEEAENIMISYGAWGDVDLYYGDWAVYEVEQTLDMSADWYINAAYQPGYSKGLNTIDSGIYTLPTTIESGQKYTVEFTVKTTGEQQDTLIGLNNSSRMNSATYFGNSTIMMKIDGDLIKVRDGATTRTVGVLSKAETTLDVIVDIDSVNNKWSVTFKEDGQVVVSKKDLSFRNNYLPINSLVLTENAYVKACLFVKKDSLKVSAEETDEEWWTNADFQYGVEEGLNSSASGIYELPQVMTAGKTYDVEFKLKTTGAQKNALIALANSQVMTREKYFANATVAMKVDSNLISVRDGEYSVVGQLDSATAEIDVKISLDLIDNTWDVTFSENGEVVAQRENITFVKNHLPIDSIVLIDNDFVANCILVDAKSLKITDTTPVGDNEITFNYVDAYGSILETVTMSGDVGDVVSLSARRIVVDGVKYGAPEASGTIKDGEIAVITVECSKVHAFIMYYIYDGYWYEKVEVEGVAGEYIPYSKNIVIRNSVNPTTKDGLYSAEGRLYVNSNYDEVTVDLQPKFLGAVSVPSLNITDAVLPISEPILTDGKVSFRFSPVDPQDAIIGFANQKLLADNYFAQSSAYIQMRKDGCIYMNNGSGVIAKGVYTPGTIYNAEFDLDIEKGLYSVTITDGSETILSVTDFEMRTIPDVIDSIIYMDNGTTNYGTMIMNDIKVETEENIWMNTKFVPGVDKGINSAVSGVYMLDKVIEEGEKRTVSFTVATKGRQKDTLIGLNNASQMVSTQYFGNSTIMMKIDGNLIKVRDDSAVTTVGVLSNTETEVDVRVTIDSVNNTWGVTFSENGEVVAECENLTFRNDYFPIDSLVLCDNSGAIGCLYVDADSVKISSFDMVDVSVEYVDEEDNLIYSETIEASLGEEFIYDDFDYLISHNDSVYVFDMINSSLKVESVQEDSSIKVCYKKAEDVYAVVPSVLTYVGKEPVLPVVANVTADSVMSEMSIVWDDINEEIYMEKGAFTAYGYVEGTSIPVECAIEVFPEYNGQVGGDLTLKMYFNNKLVETKMIEKPYGATFTLDDSYSSFSGKGALVDIKGNVTAIGESLVMNELNQLIELYYEGEEGLSATTSVRIVADDVQATTYSLRVKCEVVNTLDSDEVVYVSLVDYNDDNDVVSVVREHKDVKAHTEKPITIEMKVPFDEKTNRDMQIFVWTEGMEPLCNPIAITNVEKEAFMSEEAINMLPEYEETMEAMCLANDYWQRTTSYYQWSFWHVAAYHTGNMELYKLTENEDYLQYSVNWANANGWKGNYNSEDKESWKWQYYSEDASGKAVLFGDWQTCFQTYIDLYNFGVEDAKLDRVFEVMDYQISKDEDSFWWWCDGLYMVMPVLSKLYKLENDEKYLDAMYKYFRFAKELMYDGPGGIPTSKDGYTTSAYDRRVYDNATDSDYSDPDNYEYLFYRDASYAYPKSSINGIKNFWARGNGWVFAALAKVLADMPEEYEHYDEFYNTYVEMAKAIVDCQMVDSDGYGFWTQSMLADYPKSVSNAEGYETSGTAFFTYGLFWGINNGILDSETFLEAAARGWGYLENVALQSTGKVGYVQPIGAQPTEATPYEKTADFGVGAFLLAGCEAARWAQNQ